MTLNGSYLRAVFELYLKKNASYYAKYLRDELMFLSNAFARENVSIIGLPDILREGRGEGGVFAFLHFGNFFLSGAALCEKIGVEYTAIASKVNMQFMAEEENAFWEMVHANASACYSRKLFFTSDYPKSMIDWVKAGKFLGVAMDVDEQGKRNKRTGFEFLGKTVFLQTSAARIAKIARKPLIPMTIVFCPIRRRHKLFLGKPIEVTDVVDASCQVLKNIEQIIKGHEYQFFHDIHQTFQSAN